MANQQTGSFKPVWIYLAFTLALSSIFYFLIISAGRLGAGRGMYVTGLMWCPGLSAIITSFILKRKISLLGWQWGSTSLQVRSYFTPLIYATIAYLIIWIVGWGHFYNPEYVTDMAKSFGFEKLPAGLVIILTFIFLGLYGLPGSCANALGEEIGWRGFLTPELYGKLGYTKTSLITGLVWSLWHYPILIFADYNSGTPAWYGLSCFTVMVISISFVFTWFRIKSGSLWTAVLLHASHNLFIQGFFTPVTGDTGNTRYFVDEFGAVVPVVAICFAIYFYTRRKELNIPLQANHTA